MDSSSLKNFIQNITEKMLEAGEIAEKFQGKVANIKKEVDLDNNAPQRIKDRNQAKTEIDEKVQEMLLECVKDTLGINNIRIDAEEDTALKQLFPNEAAQVTIVIDPIDGTLEYLNGSDRYSINVGVVSHGEMLAALIYFPKLKKLYFLDNQKTSYEVAYTSSLEVKDKKVLKGNEQPQRNKVYVNNRVATDLVDNLEKADFSVIQDDGEVSWPDALLKCISGEYFASIFHSPQTRDVLLGALIENLENGWKVDWEGNKITWPNGGRIPRVIFGTGALPREIFESLE